MKVYHKIWTDFLTGMGRWLKFFIIRAYIKICYSILALPLLMGCSWASHGLLYACSTLALCSLYALSMLSLCSLYAQGHELGMSWA